MYGESRPTPSARRLILHVRLFVLAIIVVGRLDVMVVGTVAAACCGRLKGLLVVAWVLAANKEDNGLIGGV